MTDWRTQINTNAKSLLMIENPYFGPEIPGQFAKRLAAGLGTVLVLDCGTGGIKFYVGLPNHDIFTFPEKISYKVLNGMEQKYSFSSRDIYDIGDRFLIGAQELYVCQIDSFYENEELIHCYCLMSRKDIKTRPYTNDKIAGCSLKGRVTNLW